MAVCIRIQLQNTEDELRGTTESCTARNNEKSLGSSHACMVKVSKFSVQILLQQTTGRDKW